MRKFNAAEAAVLVKKCFTNFDIYLEIKEKDIFNIVDDYSKSTNAQSCIIFGSYHTNWLKG
jgi:hypothetical protein